MREKVGGGVLPVWVASRSMQRESRGPAPARMLATSTVPKGQLPASASKFGTLVNDMKDTAMERKTASVALPTKFC